MQINIKEPVLILFVCLLFLGHFFLLNGVAEDAFISFRFAENLAKGNGLLWNAGEAPVEGYTNFLWVIIASLIIALGGDVALWSQILGCLAALLTVLLVYRWCRYTYALFPLVAAIPTLLLAVSGPFAAWAGSGMETTFFGFLITLGTWVFVQYWIKDRASLLSYSAFIFTLAAMTRPEGVLVFGSLGFLALIAIFGKPRRQWKDLFWPILVFTLTFGAYFIWRYSYFGYLLPNTFYAKTGGGDLQLIRGVKYTLWFYAFFGVPLLLILGGAFFIRDKKEPNTQRNSSLLKCFANSLPLVAPIFIVCVYSLYISKVGGDYMAMFRFYAPLTPLISISLGALLAVINLRSVKPALFGVSLVAAALYFLHSTPLEAHLFPRLKNTHGMWRGVQTEAWHANRLKVIGEYFDNIKSSPDNSLATDAIGVISYVTDMKIIGMHGLVDTHIAHKKFADGELGSGLPGHERGDLPYILSKKPSFIMYNRDLTKGPFEKLPNESFDEVKEELAKEYDLVSVHLSDLQNGEDGYFTYYKKNTP